VSNGHHHQVMLDDTERHLIAILDGEHDREALIDSLRDAFASGAMVIEAGGEALQEVSNDRLSLIVGKALERLREAALLMG
jgi:methyltransferase-like protein